MKKETLRYKLVWYREALLFVAVGTSLLITLNQPKPKVTSPKTYKPVIVTEQVIEKEPVHYLTDEDFSRLYTLRSDIKNDTCIELTQADAWAVMQVAVLEDNTDAKSQAYIISVILNRVKSPLFPNSVIEVIEQEGQFATRNEYKSATPDSNSHLALAMIERGEIKTDFLYFEATWVENSWASRNRELAEVYGGTRFYK